MQLFVFIVTIILLRNPVETNVFNMHMNKFRSNAMTAIKTFHSNNAKVYHENVIHGENVRRKCDNCEETFLNMHILKSESIDVKIVTFKQKKDRMQHYKFIHRSITKHAPI